MYQVIKLWDTRWAADNNEVRPEKAKEKGGASFSAYDVTVGCLPEVLKPATSLNRWSKSSMLLPAINKSANPSSLYSSSHPEGSLNPDRHIFTRHNNVGISRFCYAPSAMQNKRPKPSTVLSVAAQSISANVYPQNPPSIPCPHEERSQHRRTSRIPAQHPWSSCHHCKPISPHIQIENSCGREERRTYPSSKCLHRFNANCAFVLQDVHSSLNTTFFVVLAFLWNTGFVWPP